MKQEFSTHWKGSKLPRKQRKYRMNAPIHTKHKMLSVSLTKELRKKYAKRNIPVIKGDNVKILVGEHKKKTGKISDVDTKRTRVNIDGIYKSKKDGTKIKVYFNPSNLQIQELNIDDKKRIKSIERKKTHKLEKPNVEKKVKKIEEKPKIEKKEEKTKEVKKETKKVNKKETKK
ncbi:50S ribosomal protein L24 [Candidatus Pacearchaeota archaeon]|nr:50S ribosomal protein L24 [Candidatus Pacearchaeota archaeon]